MDQIMHLQESLQAVENQHRHALLQIEAAQKQNDEHLASMQSEVIFEVNNLQSTISEGRKKILEEATRLDSLRNDGFQQLQADLLQIRQEAERETENAINNHQTKSKFQNYRVQTEMSKVDFVEKLHLGLYDVLEAASPPGSFTFNELDKESVEFRYYLDGVVDQSMSQLSQRPLLVLGS